MIDGSLAVPVDIAAISAALRFDAVQQRAAGDATLQFTVGATSGRPIFDLRQTITGVWLDGTQLETARIATRDLGGGPGAEMRVLDVALPAESSHTLRLTYAVDLPAAPPGGGYPPAMQWRSGPRLTFNFGFTDLAPGRYLESWIPANLIWDQFALDLDLEIVGTLIAHRLITNGKTSSVGTNHWQVVFPAGCTALSPMVELRPDDELVSATTTVWLPVSARSITVEAWKLAADASIDLATRLAKLASFLVENENNVGPYAHGDRFVAFLIQGGMEYDGGCTSNVGSLRHEAFHSWWGRGVKPASQPDAWWDEAWAVYHDGGGTQTDPFDFNEPPQTLSSRNRYSRLTPSAAYSGGERVFAGLAALSSPAALGGWMGEFYRAHLGRPTTTTALEAHLLARSGQPDVVDAFHRWIYGFGDPTPPADLWLRDAAGDTGAVPWGGRFWDSPDLWIRHQDDGGTTHQPPLAGRDNWFHARLRNRGSGAARHFAVTFSVKQFLGVEFQWPMDFLPAITAVCDFELGPGETRLVRARWPAAAVPAAGTHACWLAAVLARGDRPPAGAHTWEHGNLAQKNLAVLSLRRGRSLLVPFALHGARQERTFELARSEALAPVVAALVPRRPVTRVLSPAEIGEAIAAGGLRSHRPMRPFEIEDASALDASGFVLDAARRFPALGPARLRLVLPPGPAVQGLLLRLPADAPTGASGTIDLVQRDAAGRVIGGFAIQLSIET